MLLNNRLDVFPDPLDWITSPSELVTNFWYPPTPPASVANPEWKADEDGATLEVAVPGFGSEDILIELTDRKIKVESDCERPFSLKVLLPKELDPESVCANLKNGLLVLRADLLKPHSRTIRIQME